jgi:hypothetical protein
MSAMRRGETRRRGMGLLGLDSFIIRLLEIFSVESLFACVSVPLGHHLPA